MAVPLAPTWNASQLHLPVYYEATRVRGLDVDAETSERLDGVVSGGGQNGEGLGEVALQILEPATRDT